MNKTWVRNGLKIEMTEVTLKPTETFEGRRRKWELLEEFQMRINSEGMTQNVSVPAGFKTDFATIPIVCQLVLGYRDDWVEAAILHDHLCVTHVPRFICNAWMRAALFVLGCPRWKRVLFFYGLMFVGYRSPIQKLSARLLSYVTRK